MATFSLSDALIFEVTGRHARRYLNNRLTNDIARLAIGQSVRGAALTPQGRVEGLFRILCESEERFLLIADGGDEAALVASLLRYKVADQVTVTKRSDLTLVHSSDSNMAVSSQVSFDATRLATKGKDFVLTLEQFKNLQQATTLLTAQEVKQLRLKEGAPVFPDEIADLLIAESGCDDAVSFTKGCYVGQEVNAKIDALGEVPRKIVRVEIADSLELTETEVKAQLNERARIVGEILTNVADESSRVGFAILKNDPAVLAAPLNVSGRKVTVVTA